MAEYLRQKGNRYLVRLPVPKRLWPVVGKRALVRSTGTGDLSEARRRRHAIIADLQSEIDRAVSADPATVAWLDDQATALRRSVQRGELEAELATELIADLRERHLRAQGRTPEDHFSPSELSRLQRATRYAYDTSYVPLSERVEAYLEEKASTLRVSTIDGKRRDINLFADWLQGDPDMNEVGQKLASKFVSEVLVPRDVSAKTKQDTVSSLSAFWNFATRRSWFEGVNPWVGLAADLKDSTRGGVVPDKRKWSEDELSFLFEHLPSGGKYFLGEVSVIALYTGMRRSEIAELRLEDIDAPAGVIHVREGKSRAAVRDVPIHSKLQPLVEKLIGNRTSGHLFDTFNPTGRDKRRGHEFTKRWGYWIRQNMPQIVEKQPNGRTYAVADFHSFRRTFIWGMEQANVPVHTTEQLVGHRRSSLAYGRYSQGVDLERLREAVEKLDFGDLAIIRSFMEREA